MTPNRVIALSLAASALLIGVLGLAFVFALGNRLVGFLLFLVAAGDLGMAVYFSRRGPS